MNFLDACAEMLPQSVSLKGGASTKLKVLSTNKFDILSQDVSTESRFPKRFRKETLKAMESKQRSKKEKARAARLIS